MLQNNIYIPHQLRTKVFRFVTEYQSHCQSQSGSYLGQIISGKREGAQNRRYPNRDIKFSKSRNNWSRLNIFVATEIERKIREINLLINMQINLCVELQTIISCCVSSNFHGTRQKLRMHHLHKCKISVRQTKHGGRKNVVEITSCISS